MTQIRVLIADDHVFYREGVKSMLQARAPEIDVVGEAASGEEAVDEAQRLAPHVILMDLKMPGLGGIDATRRIRAAQPEIAILVLTMFDDDSVFEALRAGARGYLLKQVTLDDLTRAITAVHHGEAIFSPSTAERILQHFAQDGARRSSAVFPQLTQREQDVLALLVADVGTAEIARRLDISTKTVRNYVAAVLAKLQVHDRAEAARTARQAGFE